MIQAGRIISILTAAEYILAALKLFHAFFSLFAIILKLLSDTLQISMSGYAVIYRMVVSCFII